MRILVALTSIAAALALAASAATSVPQSGVYGMVVLSPATPVCKVGTPCSKPLADFPLRFSRRGRLVAQVRTNSDGRYRIRLAAGTYVVATDERGAIGRGLVPERVVVPAGRFRRLDLSYDNGIR